MLILLIDFGGYSTKDFAFALNPLLAQVARLSASCPVLNEMAPDMENVGGSLGSSPLHQPPSRKGSGKQSKLYLKHKISENILQ